MDLARQVLPPAAVTAGFTADPNLWVGSLPITGTPGTIRFMVQAVNGAGLTTLSTNQGGYYSVVDTTVPAPAPAAVSTLSFGSVPSTVIFQKPATFSAQLTSTNGPVVDRYVLFNIGGQTAQAKTSSTGLASVNIVPVLPPGSYDVSATFRGDTGWVASTVTGSFAVARESTSTEISPPTATAVSGEATGISAVVKDSLNRPLSSKSVVFEVLNSSGANVKNVVVIADLYGVAQLGALTLPAGTYTVRASFSGGPIPIPDENYNGSSSGTSALTVTAPVGPTITASAKNADDSVYVADTWTKQNVTVHYTCSVANCPPDQVITAEGETTVGSVTVTAPNGLTSSVTFGKVKIDRTPPTIAITSPTAGASYVAGSAVNAAFSCADTLSGTPGCVGTVANGQSLTTTAGVKTFTVNATDGAGNIFSQTINYTVTAPTAASPVVRADFGVSGLQSIGFQTNIVFISGSFTDADGSAPYTASVRWKATGSFSPFVLNNNSQFLSAFIYPSAGTYTATVRICDNAGHCGTDDVTIRSGVTQKVAPKLTCVLDRGVGQNPRYQARFGYANAATVPLSVLHIPILENTFTSNPYDRGQPQVFQPGTQSNVFTVNFNSGTITWRLNGATVSASSSSTRC